MIYTHLSELEDLKLTFRSYSQKTGLKPEGFWYSIGYAWLEWCQSEMPEWITEYIYAFKISSEANILKLNTPASLLTFTQTYGVPLKNALNLPQEYSFEDYYSFIRWQDVCKQYDGIEFNPYFNNLRLESNYMWYSGIDIPSGVLFHPRKHIQELTRMQTQKIRL